ncbi:uncharacterized protein GGS22DRAFT_43895 [Annulohypoxylon maeteangense]|uniref:uncharacterized protein n=1 Tax=Annulohypoxylon maeteangense TaxID=1927788 RepID=UPI002007BAC0|nr:uncharacterized protein GGS22DRAFT_43895 [Annulohypoxylon maeteangense]KAI0882424.1 hypothetical protein GGS22DRAFT_43895 [Annulohypoxylon maeteangense]
MGFRVIIVGGSVSGLSLANMLEKFGIEYLILEAHPNIAPQLGASMGLLPSSLRILDQIGCYDRIREMSGDCYYQPNFRLSNGRILSEEKTMTFSEQLEHKTGYPQVFIDRQMLLQVLFDKLKSKDRILTSKRVVRVDSVENCVHVQTEDGTTYTGDIVVGADGVRSVVRKEMWRNALESGSKLFQPDEDQGLVADSKCIFGISKRPKTLPSTDFQIGAFFRGWNYLVLSAPGNRLYWFLFQDMEKATGSSIPRFTKDDETTLAEQHFNDPVTATTTFGDIYNHRLHTALVAPEEHVFARWHFRRIITVGDAAHKVHPNSAQGGNGAIETSAVLLNSILQQLDQSSKPSEEEVEATFAEVQTNRFDRATNALEQGRTISSLFMRDSLASRLFVCYIYPWFGERIMMRLAFNHAKTGPVIERLPLPNRRGVILPHSGTVTKPSRIRVRWGFGAFGAAIVSVFLYLNRSSGWSDSLVSLLKTQLGSS